MLRAQSLPPGAIVSTRQQVPLGLGHAIWCARGFVGDEPFAVMLPDDLMLCDVSCMKQLADAYAETGGNVVAIEEVPMAQVSRYGVIAPGATRGNLVEVTGLVEKPPVDKAPSNLTVIGRYVLMPEVIGHLAKFEKGAGGEIQLTDGMAKLIGSQPFHGLRYEGRRFDCGDKAGWLEAQVAFALAREDLAPSMRHILSRYA
jgi:UTP--glucose-1-phosphate uridylyltransferase